MPDHADGGWQCTGLVDLRHTEQATARLLEADGTAPLRLRLDLVALDLVAALAVRTAGTSQAAEVGNLAERAGLQ